MEAIGRRKEATARVRLYEDKPGIMINQKTLKDYFPLPEFQNKVLEPFLKASIENKYFISVQVKGGGVTGQAEAIRLGISRALVKLDKNLKPVLKKFKLLTRDSRVVERKKYGFKKARKRPQWAKR
ncbi:MAG: 30S ribosomal protein S9 [Minisyncoccia bacterium]